MSRRIVTCKEVNGVFQCLPPETTSILTYESIEPPADKNTEEREQTQAAAVIADDYKTKVIKYIPAEIVTAYVTLEGILKASPNATNAVYWFVFLVLLALTPLYIWKVTSQPNKKPAWDQIIVSFFSFIVWVMALGGPFATLSWYSPLIPALLLPIYTLIIPMVKK